jgi:hypothetical protein
MPGLRLTMNEKDIIMEFYKAHFSAKEVSSIFPNHSLAAFFKIFKKYRTAGIKQYNRLDLMENEGIEYERTSRG